MLLKFTLRMVTFTSFLISYIIGMLNLLTLGDKNQLLICTAICAFSLFIFLLLPLVQKGSR